jgi:hypothetical protein
LGIGGGERLAPTFEVGREVELNTGGSAQRRLGVTLASSDGGRSDGVHDQHELPVEFGEVEPRCNYSWGLAGLDTGKVVGADSEFHGRLRPHIEVAARAGLVAPNYVTGNGLFIFDHSLVFYQGLKSLSNENSEGRWTGLGSSGSLPQTHSDLGDGVGDLEPVRAAVS